eukprot:scaffold321_cov267-Prasinococcus_capsulatus_cf.AAC.1
MTHIAHALLLAAQASCCIMSTIRLAGEDIDSHDMVMRFNSAKTLGFEKYVGSKTTHRITNTQNFNFRESDSEQILVHMRAKGSFDSLVKTLTEDPTAKVAGFDPSFVTYMASTFPDLLVTSGMYGIVSVQHGTLYHYYGPCDQPANPTRDGMEYEIFKDFVQHGFVNLKDDCVLGKLASMMDPLRQLLVPLSHQMLRAWQSVMRVSRYVKHAKRR